MSQGLRQRSVGGTTTATTATMNNSKNNRPDFDEVGSGLSAPSMLDASPSQHGVVLKLHVPLIFGMLPSSLKTLVMSWNCLRRWFIIVPQWHQRYLIMIGNYLYKFKNQSATTPKGTPFSLDSIDSQLVLSTTVTGGGGGSSILSAPQQFVDENDDEMAPAFAILPPGYNTIFTVSNFGKKHYYAVPSREEGLSWVNSLRQNRQEAITRNMGHAGNMPYPKAWEYFDSLGKSLQKSKERIKQKMEQHNRRELELSGIAGGGVASSGGFYG